MNDLVVHHVSMRAPITLLVPLFIAVSVPSPHVRYILNRRQQYIHSNTLLAICTCICTCICICCTGTGIGAPHLLGLELKQHIDCTRHGCIALGIDGPPIDSTLWVLTTYTYTYTCSWAWVWAAVWGECGIGIDILNQHLGQKHTFDDIHALHLVGSEVRNQGR